MKWNPAGPCAFISEDSRHSVTRSPESGWPATYVLIRLGPASVTKSGEKMWTGSTIVASEFGVMETDRRAALGKLMGMANG